MQYTEAKEQYKTKPKQTADNRYILYEQEKRKLRALNLSPEEWEIRINQLLDELQI
ncbi:hypothetical protein IJ541_05165 [bacterium]|nr:hypothetical protein [bacterium]